MKVLSIGWNGLRRLFRDRSNIFFVFILPLAIIVLVGAQFGSGGGTRVVVSHDGSDAAIQVVDGIAANDIGVDVLEEDEAVADAVERGNATAGIVIPDGFGSSVEEGEPVEVGFMSRPDSPGSLQPVLTAVLAEMTADERIAQVVAGETGTPFGDAVRIVEGTAAPGVDVELETVGEALFGPNTGQFSVGAAQQLVLFVFLTALTGSAAVIQSRQLGVTGRMLSTPTSPTEVVVGEGMARFLVGVFQGIYILVVTLVVFGVEWGDPLGWVPLLIALAATGAGAAMLVGTLFKNDQQASGISVMLGLGMAALGGAMMPLEFFSPTMLRIAHLTPHAWAVDGFSDLVYRDGSFGDVVGEIGVLLAYAAVLLGVAGWRLYRTITRA